MNWIAEKIVKRSTESLIKYENNARTHSEHQIEHLAKSMREFGFTNPILIDQHNVIIAGHGRLEAAIRAGIKEVPVIVINHLSERQKRALILQDNRSAMMAGWDLEKLAEELSYLSEADFDLELTGFNEQELDGLLKADADILPDGFTEPQSTTKNQETTSVGLTDDDEVPIKPEQPISKLGDVWRLGNHIVMCGSSTVSHDVLKLMGNTQADMVVTDPPWSEDAMASFTDPPWNVDYGQKTESVNGERREILNDKMSDKEWIVFVGAFCEMMNEALKAGAPIYVVMSGQEWPVLDGQLRKHGFHWSATIVWVKQSFVISRRDYHSRYEPIWYGWKEGAARLKPLESRNQDDVWEFPRPTKSDLHPMMKPVELVVRAIQNSSRVGDTVLDLFGGSGTTLIACEKTNRCARIMELDPRYVDVIVNRWEEFTGQKATHAELNLSFDEIRGQRQA